MNKGMKKEYLAKTFSMAILSLYSSFDSKVCFAALPPYYESSKEITAILNDPLVTEKITSGRPITSITRTETGYTMVARECSLEIKLNYLPQKDGMVGPVNFEIKPGELKCQELDSKDLKMEKD
jgi:hypothetical protein